MLEGRVVKSGYLRVVFLVFDNIFKIKIMKISLLLSFVFLFIAFFSINTKLNAQDWDPGTYGDFTYEKVGVRERKAVPYPSLREADVMFARRYERIIDTREKMNKIMTWPKSAFHDLIYEAVTTGIGANTITAYKNDSFTSSYGEDEILTRGGEEVTWEYAPDPDYPDYMQDTTAYNDFLPESIKKYKLIEDWIFDKQSGRWFVKIIGIAPLYTLKVEGEDLGEQELFFIKWSDLKPKLTNREVFNRHNDSKRLNYDDFFELRLFDSYIIKEANAFDKDIAKFEEFENNPKAALYETERIKARLFDWEHDLWEF